MKVKAIHRYARISPLKARDVAREIQGLTASDALDLLRFTPKKAAAMYEKVLKSALANAVHNFSLDANRLYLETAVAHTGPVYKRIKPRARGSAATIRKPLSHLLIILAEQKDDQDTGNSRNRKGSRPARQERRTASPSPAAPPEETTGSAE